MKFLPTRIHGLLDYAVGLLLVISPYLFGFATGGAEQIIAQVMGAGVIIYSLLTQYELGVVHAIPMPAHLVLDVIGGLVLALSPWMLGFANEIYLPHLVIGLGEIAVALVTRTAPADPAALAPDRDEARGRS